jgi:hypothetical protein
VPVFPVGFRRSRASTGFARQHAQVSTRRHPRSLAPRRRSELPVANSSGHPLLRATPTCDPDSGRRKRRRPVRSPDPEHSAASATARHRSFNGAQPTLEPGESARHRRGRTRTRVPRSARRPSADGRAWPARISRPSPCASSLERHTTALCSADHRCDHHSTDTAHARASSLMAQRPRPAGRQRPGIG